MKVKISKLHELTYNPRRIDDDQLERLKKSIKTHTEAFPEEDRNGGYRLAMSITVNKNGNRVVGGHQRLKALRSLGQDWIDGRDVTWIQVEPDSAQEKSLNVTLNSDHVTGSWDQDKLNDLVADIRIDDVDLFNALDFGDIAENLDDFDSDDLDFDDDKTKSKKSDGEEHPDDTGPISDKYKGKPGTQRMQVGENEDADGIGDVLGDSNLPEDNLPPLPPPEETTASDAPHDQLFPISYAVTTQQRECVLKAIKAAKEKFDKGTSAEALTCICNEFLETVTVES